MSTSEQIRAVFDEEICKKSRIVLNKYGTAPFFDGFRGFTIESLHDGLGIDKIVCRDYTPKGKKCQKNLNAN
jgi:hypothetical protein